MSNRGKNFEAEFKSSLDTIGMYSMRIADKLFWDGKRLISKETPADFLAYYSQNELIAFMFECKASAQKSIAFDRLQDHQEKSLIEFENYDKQCLGYVAVNFYDSDNIRAFNKCYMVPISVWLEYKDGDRKSLPLKSCDEDERIINCPRMGGSQYDMSNFVNSLNIK